MDTCVEGSETADDVRLDLDVPRGDEWPNLSALGEPGKERVRVHDRRGGWGYAQIAIEVVFLSIVIVYLAALITDGRGDSSDRSRKSDPFFRR